ncbi:MAG: C40 family peptidase [Burkholderiales bacterium]|nr:C40 family peptidase [Burkholderiales bacterium]MBK8665159.1 C40 family peptidase [Burkholderiales bacterium]
MSKKIAALIVLAIAGLQSAQATPVDDLEKFLTQKGLSSRLGDTIYQATDRAAELVSNAMNAIGVRYRLGGTSAETGFDCSGFVRAMYEQTIGMVLPRTAAEQAAATARIERTDLKPGDLVFFNTLRRAYSHVGIYLGEGKFIHAPRTGAHVRVENMNISYWQTRFNGARRVLEGENSASVSTASTSVLPRVIGRDSPAPTSVRLGGGLSRPATTVIESDLGGMDRI